MRKFKKIKKFKALILLFSALLFLVGCGTGTATVPNIADRVLTQEKPVLRWGVKADTKLFGYYNIGKGEIEGFDVDIAKALTDVMTDGRGEVELIEVTSKTRIPLLLNGNIDGIVATMTISPAREEVVDFTQVYFDAGQSLLVPNDSHLNGLDDLTAEDTVIAIKGSTSAQNIRDLAQQVTVLELENYSEGFVALQSGQGDALTTDNAILLGMISENNNYRLAGENFTEEPYGIAISPEQTEFLALANEALDTIQENGVYDQIYDKWFGEVLGGEE
ncbi:transporter substrate-binding domain-containing protein [Aerococcaceae bacterium DSM 111022]|nr:transporter substrate-binding domain-containing protein [Aerococcaceae bacterium DSM 111022]